MTKVIYNDCYGGFGLSEAAIKQYKELTGREPECFGRDTLRHDPVLVQVVEELGPDANARCAALRIAEIPKGVKYRIDEYDGLESVMTIDDYEWETA